MVEKRNRRNIIISSLVIIPIEIIVSWRFTPYIVNTWKVQFLMFIIAFLICMLTIGFDFLFRILVKNRRIYRLWVNHYLDNVKLSFSVERLHCSILTLMTTISIFDIREDLKTIILYFETFLLHVLIIAVCWSATQLAKLFKKYKEGE